jgi:16S rRNA processing protein RimM
MTAGRVLVAEIGAPHGLRGEVRLRSFTADPLTVKDYSPLEDENGRKFEIESLRPGKGVLIARLAGVSGRTEAERLTNLKLYIPRSRLPEIEQDEFYHADLVGLEVVSTGGEALGTLAAVHNFGAGDVIEVKPASGPAVMLPFTEKVVPVIDIAAGRIVVDPPEGSFSFPPVGEDRRGAG